MNRTHLFALTLALTSSIGAAKVNYRWYKDDGSFPGFKFETTEIGKKDSVKIPTHELNRKCEFVAAMKGHDPRGAEATTYRLSCANEQDKVEIVLSCFGEEIRTKPVLTLYLKGIKHEFVATCE